MPKTLTVGSLFSGIGGLDLGLKWAGFETKWFCEIEKFPQAVLRKHFPNTPIIEDVRNVTTGNVQQVDVIAGGFPCQDISVAGKMGGIQSERSGLWVEMGRAIREIRPRYAIIENVANLVGLGLERVLSDLAEMGRDASWAIIPASSVGAYHRRNRIFIVSWIPDHSSNRRQGNKQKPFPWLEALQGFENGGGAPKWSERSPVSVNPFWDRADGIPYKIYLAGMRGLGNAVVPQVGYLVGRAVMEHFLENGGRDA